MGKYIKVLLIVFMLFSSVFCAQAKGNDYQQFTENAPTEFKDSTLDDVNEEIGVIPLIKRVIGAFDNGIKSASKLFLTLCGLVILFTLFKNIQTDNPLIKNIMSAVVPITIIATSFVAIEKCMTAISESIDSASVFCTSAVPVILGLCITSGNSFSGAVFSTSVSFISTLLQRISDSVLLPLTVLCLSFAIMSNFSSGVNLMAIDKQIKKFIKWVIGSFITIFSISMSLQNFLSSSSDSMLKRSVKSAVGSFIPVVGSTLSSSVDSIFTIASNSKTMFSVLGIVIIITIFLPTIAGCICYGLSLSAVKTFSMLLNEEKCAKAIGSVADVFYLLSGICATCVVMMILSFLIICINMG